MKGACRFIFLVTVVYLVNAEYEELCERFAEGTQFREPDNCHAYVTCANGIGTVTACPNDQLYDKDNKKCVATLSDAYCNNPCEGKNDEWVGHRINCNGWYYCRSGEATYGECTPGFHFSDGLCIYSEDSTCSGVADFCGILPTGTKYADHTTCAAYYECAKKGLTWTECKTELYYDVATGDACKSLDLVPCKVHPIPANICGTDSSPKANVFVADKATCRGYYYCAYKGKKFSDKNPAWNQCVEGLFFDAATQSCVDPPLVRCTHNRCEGRGDKLVVADTWGCRYYHECHDSVPSNATRCAWDMFFSERLQACIYDEVSDPACDYPLK